jgi:glycosyltransferase involved in cell wall biosynthesis
MAMGRLTYTKRFDLLIKAFSLLSANIEAKLVIAGDGEERANLEALAKRLGVEDIVSLPGFIKNPFPYLSRADLFVLSSFSEGFSLVLVEALFGGASIVSTDCGSGPREILCGGKFGTLVEVNDERALAQAMKLRLENPFPREAQAQRALDFSTDAAVDKYTKLIENVLDK